MSEEEVQETTTEVVDTETMSNDELVAELKRVRREAANRRVDGKAKDKELAEFNAWKEAQKTELEKLTEAHNQKDEELTKLREDLAKRDMEKLQLDVAKEAGLDLELADRIRGKTKDEMLEDAERLAALASSGVPTVNPFAGARGAAVGPKSDVTSGEAFKNWIANTP